MSSMQKNNRSFTTQSKRVIKRNTRSRADFIPRQPPTFTANPVFRQTFRWICAEPGTFPGVLVGTADLLNILVLATSSTTTVSLIQAVKVIKITAWAGAMTSLQWSCAANGNVGAKISSSVDVSVGDTYVSKVRLRPVPKTSSDDWQNYSVGANANTNGLDFYAYFSGPGGYIDVDLLFQLQSGNTANPGQTSTGLTPGVIYQQPLANSDIEAFTAVGIQTFVPS